MPDEAPRPASRPFAQSWFARIVLGLIIVAMAGFGLSQYGFDSVRGDAVIKAGSRTINSADFRREYDAQKKRIEQQRGQPITPEQAQEGRLDALVLNGVATREALAEMLSKIGVQPADKLIADQISKITAFFDPITGKFDENTFKQRLAENGLTPARFDAGLRDEIAQRHWAVAIQDGLAVPRSYGALIAIYGLETRDIAHFVIPPGSVPQPPAPTDAQLNQVILENKQAFQTPETRTLTVVGFFPGAVAQSVQAAPIDPAELQKRYNFRKDTLSQPETRSLVQIPVKSQAEGQQAVGRLTRGDDPAAVAKALGVDAVTFDAKPMTAISDRKVGQAAFKMAQGAVAVVQGDLGLAAVKVIQVNPGQEVSLEEARPMLEAEIRKDMITEKVYAQTQTYDEAHQAGSGLAEAAQKAGVTAQTIGPLTAQGIDVKTRQQYQLPPKLLEVAFALPAGGESEITELGDGAYFAVKVEAIAPAHVMGLAEVRPQVTQAWIRREIGRALEARAQALMARVKKGESLDAVAASAGHPVVRTAALSRRSAQQTPEGLQQVIGRAFAAKSGDVFMAPTDAGIAVGQVSNIRAEATMQAGQAAEASRGQLTQALFGEMAESASGYARAKLKVKTNAELARTAVGFEAEAPKGKAAEKKK